MGSLAPVLLIVLAARRAPSESSFDPNVALRVSIAGDRREFHIGETIPIQLSFSAAVENRYQVNEARYDRSGRMEYERFSVSHVNGAVDPLANRPGGIGGGLTTYKFLSAEPWTITLNLNEWLRFTRPGEYELTVSSRRVGVKDSSRAAGESPVTARADPIKLRIVPAPRLAKGRLRRGSGLSRAAAVRDAARAPGTILPAVLGKLDRLIGQWECASQDAIRGYVLRVSPALARPRVEHALAARGEGFTSCRHGLLQTISEIHYDPVLEDIGIQSLDDPDPQVAMTAATMVGRFGSPAAEPALWQRYASWSAKWKGREAELVVLFSEGVDDRIYELGLGERLAQALASGKSWLSDEPKLRRLARMTSVKRLREGLEIHLKAWEGQPLHISLSDAGPPLGFRAQVAHYEFQDMGALEEKLGQFPSGTAFFLRTATPESRASDEAQARVRKFLSTLGMVVTGQSASP
jgi:hypothetical protein